MGINHFGKRVRTEARACGEAMAGRPWIVDGQHHHIVSADRRINRTP
jgi:hypothetical protein